MPRLSMFFDYYKSGYFIFMPGPVLHEKNMHSLVKNTDEYIPQLYVISILEICRYGRFRGAARCLFSNIKL